MNRSAARVAEVPAAVVTVMSTVPLPGGLVAVICVAESTVNVVAAVPPKRTPVAPVKPVPVMVTVVPPVTGPLAGKTPVTTGTEDGGGTMMPVPLRTMSCDRGREAR